MGFGSTADSNRSPVAYIRDVSRQAIRRRAAGAAAVSRTALPANCARSCHIASSWLVVRDDETEPSDVTPLGRCEGGSGEMSVETYPRVVDAGEAAAGSSLSS